MKKLSWILLLVGLSLLVGCEEENAFNPTTAVSAEEIAASAVSRPVKKAVDEQRSWADQKVLKLDYFYDARTKCCFAYMSEMFTYHPRLEGGIVKLTTGGSTLSSVPCTPDVMKHVLNPPLSEPASLNPSK